MNVINDPYGKGKSVYGTGLDSALSSGIQNIANMKVNQIQQQKNAGIYKNLGINPNISHLPQEQQNKIVEEHFKQQGGAGINQQGQTGQRLNDRQQRQVDTSQKRFNEGLSKAYENSYETQRDIEEALQLLDTGQTRSGLAGNLPLNWTGASAESHELNKVYKRLAGRLANQNGVSTNGKIKFAEAQKPDLSQPIEAQRYLLNSLLKETQRPMALAEIRDQLIADNDYKTPVGLEQKVNEAWQRMQSEQNQPQAQSAQNQQGNQQVQQNQAGQQQPPEGESPIGKIARGALRTGSRAVESVLGAPGDIANLAVGGANYLAGGKIEGAEKVQEYLPTSEKFKQLASYISSGYTDPQGGVEEFLDDIVGTATSLIAPSRLAGPAAKAFKWAGAGEKLAKGAAKVALPFSGVTMSIPKAVGLSSAGELAKTAAGVAGLGPVGQAGAKLLTMAVAGKSSMKKMQKANYDGAKESFKNQTSNTKNIFTKLRAQRNTEKNEILSKSTRAAIDEVDDEINMFMKKSFKNKYEVPVNEVIDARQGVSNFMGRTGFDPQTGQELMPTQARELIDRRLNLFDEALAKASETNKQGGKSLAIANDFTRARGTFDKAEYWIAAHMPKNPFSAGWKLLKGSWEKLGATKDFLLKYPEARNAYMKALSYAAYENSSGFTREIAKIDQIVKHKEKK